MKPSVKAVGVISLFAVLAFAAAGCGGGGNSSSSSSGGGGGNLTALPTSSCSSIYYEGDGDADFIVASDLPLQGAGRAQTTEMVQAIKFALKQRNFKAGDYKIAYQSCDDSTAQAGAWDSAKCASNGRSYASNQAVIGVVGTFNSGCAKIIVPILNRAVPGPVAMVSPANTSPGLTTDGPGAEAGEPDKYYPTGKRNYARVVANDQIQGPADAQFAKDQGLKSVYILNDKQTYGFGVATTFRGAAQKLGLNVAGFKGWDAKQSSYEALANAIKATGADAIFLGGIICNNGAKLIKDLKQGVPGATLIAPDGFSRSEVERHGVRRLVRQRRGPAAVGPEGRGQDVRGRLRQADRRDAESVLAVRRAGHGRHARRHREVGRHAALGHVIPLRPAGEERDHRHVHAQRQGRHEPGPDHDLPAEGGQAQPAEDDRAREEPDAVAAAIGGAGRRIRPAPSHLK